MLQGMGLMPESPKAVRAPVSAPFTPAGPTLRPVATKSRPAGDDEGCEPEEPASNGHLGSRASLEGELAADA